MTDSQGEPKLWWFNQKTKLVEYGRKTNSIDRIGPFVTESEAKNALEVIRTRAEQWRLQEENED